MRKILILNIVLLSVSGIFAQNDLTITDSVTYSLYYQGKWNELIKYGDAAIADNIDFKWLRQRLGYAWYMKGNYYNAMKHYEKAYAFDVTDKTTLLYLYYSGLNTGNSSYSRYFAEKFQDETKNYFKIKAFKPFDVFDAEFNYKSNDYFLRSAATYFRGGINSQFGYRLNLYQTYANFRQEVEYGTVQLKQNEYFALLTYTLTPKTYLSGGYHLINTYVNSESEQNIYHGNLFFGKIQQNIHCYDLSLSTSVYNNEFGNVFQAGTQFGVVLPGKFYPYLKSSVYYMNDFGTGRMVFQQSAGAFVMKKLWAEANVTLGNQNNLTDANGLYFYNSYDPTIFRTGLSLFAYLNKNIILSTNYTYNKKEVTETLFQYNQHSITGGIIWKL